MRYCKHDLPFKLYGYFISCCHCGSQDEANRTGTTEDGGEKKNNRWRWLCMRRITVSSILRIFILVKNKCVVVFCDMKYED